MNYSQQALLVLVLLGVLSAIMSLMSVSLIFELHVGLKEPGFSVQREIWSVLKPLSVVLSALALTLNTSTVFICLLHAYFTTEMGREHAHRADWFLLNNRFIRHAAIGLFCFGISFYLGALSIYMLLVFEIETGIVSVCLLSSGVLVLLVVVVNTLIRVAHTAKHFNDQHIDTVYQNDPESNTGISTIASEPSRRENAKMWCDEGSQFCYTLSTDVKPQFSNNPHSHSSKRETYAGSERINRTQYAEPGLIQTHSEHWSGINHEMRTVLARKTKDSTLV